MVKRLNQHNAGFGSLESAPKEKRPWGLYAYVTGFSGSKKLMEAVEGYWQRSVQFVKPTTPREGVRIVQRLLVRDYSQEELIVVLAEED